MDTERLRARLDLLLHTAKLEVHLLRCSGSLIQKKTAPHIREAGLPGNVKPGVSW
jgi:hypothetical protein